MNDPIQDSQNGELIAVEPAVRSGVKIETSAKGFAQVKVQVYAGETEEEMERIKNLAVLTYEKTIAQLGAARASL